MFVERTQNTAMDPGSQQTDCLFSTSSDSKDSLTKVLQIDTSFAHFQADGSKTVFPTSSPKFERGSEDFMITPPRSDCSANNNSETAFPTSSSSSERGSEDLKITPPKSDCSVWNDSGNAFLTLCSSSGRGLGDFKITPATSAGSGFNDSETVYGTQSSTVEYQQEPFETYQHKVSQLCQDIGFGEPSKIERMKGGGYNRVVGLNLPSGQKHDYILRIPRGANAQDEDFFMPQIKDQVAVTLYLSRYDFLHVPVIAAYDTTTNNVLECQYVLQERIDGCSLADIFYTLPLSEKLQITRAVAEMLVQLESITLERPGRLVGTGDLPARSDTAPAFAKDIKITGYRNNPMEDWPVMEKQPLMSLIISLLEIRKQKNLDWDEMVERCERLQGIAREMVDVGLVRVRDKECALWHWDLSAANIMISRYSANDGSVLEQSSGRTTPPPNNRYQKEWVVSGVLDWDDALSVPLVLARKPPSWLWLDEDKRGSAFVNNPDRDAKPERSLTQDELLIKAYFDQIMAEASPSYIEDAYHRGPWLRALASFALYNFEDGWYWDKYDGFVKNWEEHYATIRE